MISIKKACAILFIIHSFFCINSNADEILHPSYYDFIERFPDGYPNFNESGNPKSMGAFKLYLEDLGYFTFDNQGNSIGFKFQIRKIDENSKTGSKNDLTELNLNQEKIAKWVKLINYEIEEKLMYPISAKKRAQTGRVLVSISVLTSGEIVDVGVELSSNFIYLDQFAIKTIQNIESFTPAPFKAKNKIFTFILPISFKLEN